MLVMKRTMEMVFLLSQTNFVHAADIISQHISSQTARADLHKFHPWRVVCVCLAGFSSS